MLVRLWPVAVALLAGCRGPDHPPPPPNFFDGLPVSGSLDDALQAGFTRCRSEWTEMRCRRDSVMLLGQGPFNAAVDLDGGNGGGGFAQLTLWHDRDQSAVISVGALLERHGWRTCYTGAGRRGNQAIYTREGAHVRFSMDLSYWGKRRLRIIPQSDDGGRPMLPAHCSR
jgi:hypothetical protein